MNDAEYEAQKSTVEGYIDAWKPRMRLDAWFLVSHHYRSSGEYDKQRPEHAGSVACCAVRWPYMAVNIHFNHEALADDDEGIEAVVVHEMAHILVAQMHYTAWEHMPEDVRGMWCDHHERVTTMVTNALMKTRDMAVSPS